MNSVGYALPLAGWLLFWGFVLWSLLRAAAKPAPKPPDKREAGNVTVEHIIVMALALLVIVIGAHVAGGAKLIYMIRHALEDFSQGRVR